MLETVSLGGSWAAGIFSLALCSLAALYLVIWLSANLVLFLRKKGNRKKEEGFPITREMRSGDGLITGCSSILGTRHYQQDRVLTDPAVVAGEPLAIVCDGMGGMDNGERASDHCVRGFYEGYCKKRREADMESPTSVMEDLARQLDREVANFEDDSGNRIFSGTTLVAAAIARRRLYWISVGDSRIYLYRGGALHQLTRDHNLALRLQLRVEQGELTLKEAKDFENKEALVSYLGADGLEFLDSGGTGLLLEDKDLILLCSDGLYKILKNEEIAEILADTEGLTPGQIAAELTRRASLKAVGPQDNTTAAVLRVPPLAEERQEKAPQDGRTARWERREELMENSKKICMSCFRPMGEFEVCPHCGWVEQRVPKESYHLYPGTVLQDRYLIGVVLDFGGFGIAYKAWDMRLSKIVAIKEYYPAGLVNRIPGEKEVLMFSGEKSDQFRYGIDRFLAEARNMAKFSDYPYIVNVYDFFEENHTAYIVMEYLDGVALNKYLKQQGGRLSFEDTMAIAEPVMRALEEIHKKGILHRDISPDNIFILSDGRIKVIDFGAARLATGEQELTLSVIIKPGYAPPEQYRSKSRQGPWTDVYALGATLYRCLTGVLPEESVDRVVEDNLKRPRDLGAELPEYAEKAIMKALALKEGLRFSKMEQFRLAMTNQKKVDYPEIEYKKRRRRRIIGGVVSAVALIGVIGGVVGYQQYMSPTVHPDTITVWVPTDAQEDTAYAVMRDIADKFTAEQEGFKVELIAVPKTEYGQRLEQAAKDGTLPTVFRSDLTEADLTDGMAQMTYLYYTLDKEKCLFLKAYSSYYPQQQSMPTGFLVPVVYTNDTLLGGLGIERLDSYTELEQLLPDIQGIDGVKALVVEPRDAVFLPEGKEEPPAASATALADFGKRKTLFYLADSAVLHQVQELLPGAYGVAYLEAEGSLVARFTDEYSVSGLCERNTQLAGMMFINYLFSDYAQNVLYTQRDAGLPLNRAEFEKYVTETNNDFEPLLEEMKDISITAAKGEGQ